MRFLECLVKVDLMIVLDGSYSVTPQNFDLVKDWVKSLVGEMHLNHGHTQVGVVSFFFFLVLTLCNRLSILFLNNTQYLVKFIF